MRLPKVRTDELLHVQQGTEEGQDSQVCSMQRRHAPSKCRRAFSSMTRVSCLLLHLQLAHLGKLALKQR